MSVRLLVEVIQSLFPPEGRLPPLPPQGARSADATDPSEEQTAMSRPPVPDWVEAGTRIPVRPGDKLVSESPLAETDAAPRGPADVLAYYLPFHFYSAGRWGIYLRADGIRSLAAYLASASKSRSVPSRALDVATAILDEHERWHFFAEVACSRAEVLQLAEFSLYRHYFADPQATAIEEALCNAHAFRSALRGQPQGVRQRVETWMRSRGGGYGDFKKCLSARASTGWRRSAVDRMLMAGSLLIKNPAGKNGVLMRSGPNAAVMWFYGRPPRTETTPTEFLFNSIPRSATPLYLVQDVQAIGVLRPFPKYLGIQLFIHTNDHPPPHVHLHIPPGREVTRLKWPEYEPLPGDRELNGKERKRLRQYLARHGREIERKMRSIWAAA
jgi:hypothetical protein